jgi:hypothetical protein
LLPLLYKCVPPGAIRTFAKPLGGIVSAGLTYKNDFGFFDHFI